MRSRGLRAVLFIVFLTLFAWISYTRNREIPESLLYNTESTQSNPSVHSKSRHQHHPQYPFTNHERSVGSTLPGGISKEMVEEIIRAAKHWTNGTVTDADLAAVRDMYGDNSEPNGRPAMPPPADGPFVDPHFKNGHTPEPGPDESGLDDAYIDGIIDSIFDLDNTQFWRMECPGQERPGNRYKILKTIAKREKKIKYFFALDLTQTARILPRLMASVAQVIRYLGPEYCALSIVEGRSSDGTYRILHSMGKRLVVNNIEYYLQQSDVDPKAKNEDRIGALARLRNLAMAPLFDDKPRFSKDTITIFVNDIAVCPDDILELIYQHVYQDATMVCAMDWVYGGDCFYDSWVSRSMSGNTFFEIPQDVSFAFHKNLFWDDPISKPKYEKFHPFQCYSCWGGMVTLDSKPFQNGEVTFRNSSRGECYAGEPTLLAQDLYRIGQGRVMTVPSVNVAYNDPDGSRTKKRRGYVADRVNVTRAVDLHGDDDQSPRIKWLPPPRQVKCMPTWNRQSWIPPF